MEDASVVANQLEMPAESQVAAVTIVDLPVRISGGGRKILSYLIFFVLMSFTIGVLIGVGVMISAGGQVMSLLILLVVVVFVTIAMGFLPAIQRYRARKRARQIVAAHPDASLAELANSLAVAPPYLSGPSGYVELAKLFASKGVTNGVIRLARWKDIWPIHPTDVSFEPRPIDESDPAFVELAEATAAEAAGAEGFEFTSPDKMPLRRIRRNIRMKGGYVSLVVCLLFFTRAAIESFVAGRFTIWLGFWSVLLVMKLFAPATGAFNTWMVVPRGILIDRRKQKDARPFLLADRLASNLVVRQTTRQTWSVHLVTADESLRTIATSREVEMLFRAWTSDVPPPGEQVVAAMLLGVAAERPAFSDAEAGDDHEFQQT